MARVLRSLVLGGAGVVLLSLAGVHWGNGGTPPSAAAQAQATILVAARQLDADARLSADDVEARVVPAATLPGSFVSAAQVVGRRLLVTLPPGTPLLAPMLGPASGRAGSRTVVVVTDGDHIDPGIAPGAQVDVIAAVDGDGHGGAVTPVAVAEVVRVAPAAGSPSRSTADRSAGSAGATAVTLDCDDASALRVVWAESYARSLRLLIRDPAATSSLSTVDSLSR